MAILYIIYILIQGYRAADSTARKGQNDGVKLACNHFNNFDRKLPGVSVVDAQNSKNAVPKIFWLGVNRQRFKTMTDVLEEKVSETVHDLATATIPLFCHLWIL